MAAGYSAGWVDEGGDEDGRMKTTTEQRMTTGAQTEASLRTGGERGGVGVGVRRRLEGFSSVTCMAGGRGRGRVPAHDLRSSSKARLSISNCLSCSRTEARREAVLAHCSIHTLGASTGQDSTGQETGKG